MRDRTRTEVLTALGLTKAPELVTIRGQVAPWVATTMEQLAKESGLKVEEVVGLAVGGWLERAQRRLRQAQD